MTTEADEFAAFASTLSTPVSDTEPAAEPAAKPADEPLTPEEEAAMAAALEGASKTEEAKPEAAKPEAKPEEKKETTDWKAVAQKEREKREARAAKRSAETKQTTELEELRAKAARFDAITGKVGTSKLEAVKELGVNYDELTEEYLDKLTKDKNLPAPLTPEQKRIADLEAKVAEQEKRATDAEAARLKSNRDETIRSVNSQIDETVTAKSDEFELLNRKPAGKQAVFKLLVEHHASSSGEVLSIEDACREIEAVLRDDAKATADTKFVRSLVSGEAPKTLSGDMRESGLAASREGDDDREFLNHTLRLLKTNSP